jgi:hypothetical protein
MQLRDALHATACTRLNSTSTINSALTSRSPRSSAQAPPGDERDVDNARAVALHEKMVRVALCPVTLDYERPFNAFHKSFDLCSGFDASM